jgi:hypothetical protein
VTGATLSGRDIVKSLLAMVLLPLVVGLAIKARHPGHAAEWQPGLVRVANGALVVALATGIAANWQTIVSMFFSWVIITVVVIIVITSGAGMLLGGRDAETRTTTTLVSGMRFASLGLIIIGTRLDGAADYIGPALTFALLDFLLPLAAAVEIGRTRRDPTDPAPATPPRSSSRASTQPLTSDDGASPVSPTQTRPRRSPGPRTPRCPAASDPAPPRNLTSARLDITNASKPNAGAIAGASSPVEALCDPT